MQQQLTKNSKLCFREVILATGRQPLGMPCCKALWARDLMHGLLQLSVPNPGMSCPAAPRSAGPAPFAESDMPCGSLFRKEGVSQGVADILHRAFSAKAELQFT